MERKRQKHDAAALRKIAKYDPVASQSKQSNLVQEIALTRKAMEDRAAEWGTMKNDFENYIRDLKDRVLKMGKELEELESVATGQRLMDDIQERLRRKTQNAATKAPRGSDGLKRQVKELKLGLETSKNILAKSEALYSKTAAATESAQKRDVRKREELEKELAELYETAHKFCMRKEEEKARRKWAEEHLEEFRQY